MKILMIYLTVAAIYAATVGAVFGRKFKRAPWWKKAMGFTAAGLLWPANIIGLAWIAVRTAIWTERARRAAR